MFDPASFFGHSEFELAIMDMFGGFEEPFWAAYHAKVGACVLVCMCGSCVFLDAALARPPGWSIKRYPLPGGRLTTEGSCLVAGSLGPTSGN